MNVVQESWGCEEEASAIIVFVYLDVSHITSAAVTAAL